jgi:hypothetical protein
MLKCRILGSSREITNMINGNPATNFANDVCKIGQDIFGKYA